MMIEIVACLSMVVMGIFIGLGLFYYLHSKRDAEKAEAEEQDKSLLSLSQSRIIEMPVRKEKSPLYIFKNGKKQEFVMDSKQTFEIRNK